MRFSPTVLCLMFGLLCSTPVALRAQESSFAEDRAAARRALEMAKLELRLYHQVEYPRERRHLHSKITLTEAEIQAYKERLREYRPFDRFSTGRPLLVPIQDLRLCLLEAELRLRDLIAERNALVRFHSDAWRLLELKVHEARLRVAMLEAGDNVAVVESHAPQPQ